jgi:hypothetical protein
MVGLMAVVLFAMIGLAIDVGRIFVTKAELSRDVDAAALSGVLDLPNISDAQTRAMSYLSENDPDADGSASLCAGADNCLYVEGNKTVDLYFLSLLGFSDVEVSAHAKAGFGIQPVDAVLVLDSTASMVGNPITQAKNAAEDFVDTLLGDTPSGYTQVGLTPFRGCFDEPNDDSRCVDDFMVIELTTDKTTLLDRIDDVDAQGGSGTNVCTGLWRAAQILDGSTQTGSNLRKFVILLSDGDNNYNGGVAYENNSGTANDSPPVGCQPTPWDTGSDGGTDCNDNDNTRERTLDTATYNMAQQLKDDGAEIYIVAFGVCDWDDETSDPCNVSDIGTTAGPNTDNDRDQNLMKCVASGPEYTYFANSADDLPTIFTAIAQQIAHRLIE